MRGVLLLNGEPYAGKIDDRGALVYCCDGAYNWAKGKVRIDKNFGDFDSAKREVFPPPSEIVPAEKNFTDGELGLKRLIADGVDEIEIYGAGGGRDDHFLGNLHLLYCAREAGVKACAITNYTRIFLGENHVFLGNFAKKTFSVLPFGGEVHIINYGGLKYDYPEKLVYGTSRGISNIVLSDDAFLEVGGVALILIVEGEL